MYIFTHLEFNLMQVNLDFSLEQDMIKEISCRPCIVACGLWVLVFYSIFLILFFVFSSSCVHLTDCNNNICELFL
jgi:hypothetical protein